MLLLSNLRGSHLASAPSIAARCCDSTFSISASEPGLLESSAFFSAAAAGLPAASAT